MFDFRKNGKSKEDVLIKMIDERDKTIKRLEQWIVSAENETDTVKKELAKTAQDCFRLQTKALVQMIRLKPKDPEFEVKLIQTQIVAQNAFYALKPVVKMIGILNKKQ